MSKHIDKAIEALDLVASVPMARGGVYVLDRQDMEFVRDAAITLRYASYDAAELLGSLILMVRTHDEPAETLLQEAKEQQWLLKARALIAKATGAGP